MRLQPDRDRGGQRPPRLQDQLGRRGRPKITCLNSATMRLIPSDEILGRRVGVERFRARRGLFEVGDVVLLDHPAADDADVVYPRSSSNLRHTWRNRPSCGGAGKSGLRRRRRRLPAVPPSRSSPASDGAGVDDLIPASRRRARTILAPRSWPGGAEAWPLSTLIGIDGPPLGHRPTILPAPRRRIQAPPRANVRPSSARSPAGPRGRREARRTARVANKLRTTSKRTGPFRVGRFARARGPSAPNYDIVNSGSFGRDRLKDGDVALALAHHVLEVDRSTSRATGRSAMRVDHEEVGDLGGVRL